jgi:hypothetical protein
VTIVLYEKELKTITSNKVLNKVIVHELRNGIKPREQLSSPTHSACKKASQDVEEDGDPRELK